MKTKILLIFLLTIFGLQIANAESYQRWVYPVNKPGHVFNAIEMAKIISAIYKGWIDPDSLYQVDGIIFRIPHPDLYLKYICICVRVSDPKVQTMEDIIDDIKNGQVVRWGNDISCRVTNYWVQDNGEISWTPNYSGAELGVWILLVNSIPTIKLDCGNPLGLEGNPLALNPRDNEYPTDIPNIPPTPPTTPPTTSTPNTNNGGTTVNIIINGNGQQGWEYRYEPRGYGYTNYWCFGSRPRPRMVEQHWSGYGYNQNCYSSGSPQRQPYQQRQGYPVINGGHNGSPNGSPRTNFWTLIFCFLIQDTHSNFKFLCVFFFVIILYLMRQS